MGTINGPDGPWESGNVVKVCHGLQSLVLLGGFLKLIGHASQYCRDYLMDTPAHGGLCHPSQTSTCVLERPSGKEMECCHYFDERWQGMGSLGWGVKIILQDPG